jgi:hypothetical protein
MAERPSDHSLRGRIGAFAQHSRYDTRETTSAGRAAFLAKFELEVDPDGTLPVPERHRRAVARRREYFARLALASAVARRKRATPISTSSTGLPVS